MKNEHLAFNVAHVFFPKYHHIRYLKNIYDFIPGRKIEDWTIKAAIKCGHLFVLQNLLKQGHKADSCDADLAACLGQLTIVDCLRSKFVLCTPAGVNSAARSEEHTSELQSLMR